MIKSEISVSYVKSLNFSNLENFGDSLGENDTSWKVDHTDVVQNYISENFHFNHEAKIKSEISVRFVKSLNFSNLENFGDSWGENDVSWKVDQ